MKNKTYKIFLLLIVFIINIFNVKTFSLNYPKAVGYVNDFAKVMTVGEQKILEAILSNYESKSTIEIVVVTITSLNGQNIEKYTLGLANEWGVGKEDKDNGIIILNVIEEKKWRIEVGYGLKEYMTDTYGTTLGDEFLTPLLKQGKYFEAYKGTVEKIMKDFGNFTEKDKTRLIEEKEDSIIIWLVLIIIILSTISLRM